MRRHVNIYFGLTLLFLATFLSFNFDASGQDLKVKFHNRTGFDVDQILVNETFVGSIPKDSVTDLITFPSFWLDDGSPREKISGIYRKEYIANSAFQTECGSGIRQITAGELHLDILIKTVEEVDYLFLARHY